MKTAELLKAIEALDLAGDALYSGQESIARQIYIGGKCRVAATWLREALIREYPDIKIEESPHANSA